MRGLGLDPSDADIDLFTALVAGLVDQQWANDPGGTAGPACSTGPIDMYADDLDLPEEEP